VAAYIIGELLEVTDPAGFEEYRRRVPETIARYGGKFVARQGAIERLDGQWQPRGLTSLGDAALSFRLSRHDRQLPSRNLLDR